MPACAGLTKRRRRSVCNHHPSDLTLSLRSAMAADGSASRCQGSRRSKGKAGSSGANGLQSGGGGGQAAGRVWVGAVLCGSVCSEGHRHPRSSQSEEEGEAVGRGEAGLTKGSASGPVPP